MSRRTLCSSIFAGISSLALLASFNVTPVLAQSSDASVVVTIPAASARPIITGQVNESKLVAVHSPAIPEGVRDLGPTSGETKIGLQLVLRRSPEADQALKLLLSQTLDPTSAIYGKTVTPREFAQTFGLAASDLETLKSTLAAAGFTVGNVDNGRLTIDFEGTVTQANAAFHTEIHNYQGQDSVQHFAPASPLQVPAAFGGVVARINGAQNFVVEERPGFNAPVVDFVAGAVAEKIAVSGSGKPIVPILSGEALHDGSFTASKYVLGLKGSTTLNVRIGGNTHPAMGSLAIEDQNGRVVGFVADISQCQSYNDGKGRSCTADFKAPVGASLLKAVYSGDENERGGDLGHIVIDVTGTGPTTLVASAVPITLYSAAAPNSTLTMVLSYYNVVGNPAPTGTISVVYDSTTTVWGNVTLPTTAGGTSSGTGTSTHGHTYTWACSGNATEQTFTCTIALAGAFADGNTTEGAGVFNLAPSYSGDVNYAGSTTAIEPGLYITVAASTATSSVTPTGGGTSQTYGTSTTVTPTTVTVACSGCNAGRLDGGTSSTTAAALFVYGSAATGAVANAGQVGTSAEYILNGACNNKTSCPFTGASWTSSANIAPGSYTITYYYTGNGGTSGDTVAPATGSYTYTVNKFGPTLSAITANPTSVGTGSSTAVTLSDTFTIPTVGVLPSGTVNFTLNSVAYPATCVYTTTAGSLTCSATVPAATVAALAAGSYTISSSFAGDNYYSAVTTGGTGTFSVKSATTATMVTPTATTPTTQAFGNLSAFTVTGQLAWTGTPAPTKADVSFVVTGGVAGAATCTGTTSPYTCTATFTPTSTDAVGNYNINLSFSGDGSYTASTSTQAGNYVVSKGTITTIQMTTSAFVTPPTVTTQTFGTTTAFPVYATLSPVGATGVTAANVTFSTSTAGIGTFGATSCTVVSGVDRCSATFTPNGTAAVGSYNINASFSGDSNYNSAGPSTNGVGNYVVTKATPTVTLSNVTATYGVTTAQAITVTATGDNGAVATFGTAGGVGGSFSPATCTIASNTCSSTYIPSGTLTAGTYTNDLTVSVAATTNYNSGSDTSTLTISKHSTTTALTVAPTFVSAASPQAVFTSVTNYSASVGSQATGSISISASGGTWTTITGIAFPAVGLTTSSGSGATDGGYTYACTTNLAAETVTCVVTVPAAYSHLTAGGTRTMTSTYSGDTNYTTSPGTANLGVAGTSTTSMTLSNASVPYGSGSTASFTATLTGTYTSNSFLKPTSATYPTGTITLTNPTLGTLNTITLNTTGSTPCVLSFTVPSGSILNWTVVTSQVCTITYTVPVATAVGGYTITGTYSGDTMFASTTATGTLTVTPAVISSIVLAADTPGSTTTGVTSVNFTATINPALAGVTVNFNDASTGASYQAITNAAGQATLAITTGSVGVSGGLNKFNATVTASTNYGAAGPSNTVNLYLQGVLITTTLNHNFSGLISYGSPAITVEGTVDGTKLGPFGIVVYNFTPTAQPVGLNFTNAGSGAFSFATNCPTSLAAGKTCNYFFYYQPPNGDGCNPTTNCTTNGLGDPQGTYEAATWQVTSGALLGIGDTGFDRSGAVTFPATLAGKAVLPATSPLSVTPLNYTFGPLAPGGLSNTLTISVTNTSASSVSLSYTPPATTPFQATNYCPMNLAAGANCNINVTFQSSTLGTTTATVGITPGGGQTISVALTGIVNSNTGLQLNSNAHNFGNVTTGSSAQAFGLSITNNGATAASLSFGTSQGGTTPFNVGTGGCPSSLAAGAQCSVIVNFSPTATGSFNDVLTITSDTPILPGGTGSGPYTGTVTFTGAGVTSGQFTASSVGHNWGDVTVGTTGTNYGVQLTNTTTTALTLNLGSGFTAGLNGFNLAGTNCGATLPVNGSCELIFSFSPTAAGMVTASYGVTATDGTNPVQLFSGGTPASAISLVGTGQ